ncbi:MAG: hypothetical protein CM1200mP23_3700 [Nitrososphaerota archaeon]|nr:MAG: hypothetical protein CM1200mP23_3700 [Nitrososphaerota archaeon]
MSLILQFYDFAAIVTLAFFKIRQPLIIGYLFAGMLIGPLSPLWSSILPGNGGSGTAAKIWYFV